MVFWDGEMELLVGPGTAAVVKELQWNLSFDFRSCF